MKVASTHAHQRAREGARARVVVEEANRLEPRTVAILTPGGVVVVLAPTSRIPSRARGREGATWGQRRARLASLVELDTVCIYLDRSRTKSCRNLRVAPLFCEGVGFRI